MNWVCVSENRVIIPHDTPLTQGILEGLGVECHTVDISEYRICAGGIGCATGILSREV